MAKCFHSCLSFVNPRIREFLTNHILGLGLSGCGRKRVGTKWAGGGCCWNNYSLAAIILFMLLILGAHRSTRIVAMYVFPRPLYLQLLKCVATNQKQDPEGSYSNAITHSFEQAAVNVAKQMSLNCINELLHYACKLWHYSSSSSSSSSFLLPPLLPLSPPLPILLLFPPL